MPAPADLTAALRAAVRGTVDDGARRRAEYSSDAGNYRVRPRVVVQPVDADEVAAVVEVAHQQQVPVTARGAGTSIAGNAVGPGIVLDVGRRLTRILDVDPDARTAVVEPGVVLSDLQRRVAPLGLRFGPDPSSQDRCTIGGMIGNNACGVHAVSYGRTSDNVIDLDVVDGHGRRLTLGAGPGRVPGLDALVDSSLATIRTEFGRFSRQVSGYGLEHLLPEHGRQVARAFVGSEGTLGVVTRATLRLVPISPVRLLIVLGYPDMAHAADAVPALLAHRPHAIEGLDARIVDILRRARGAHAVPELPRGAGWLMVEVGGDSPTEAAHLADALVRDGGAVGSMVLPAGPHATALWRIRADGAGLAGRTPDGRPAWPGWEDAAVPPERLGGYLREFETLLADAGLTGVPYGHFGDGCVHIRIDFPLATGSSEFRAFMLAAARLVVAHGGSCSGEHGDGRARGELLPLMYSPAAIETFARFKTLFDPDDLLNPGILVRPAPLDADLRRPAARTLPLAGGFAFAHDAGDLTSALHRCVGVGKCRADTSAAGGFMCPSFRASGDEKDVTRGRARVLQELAQGSGPVDWRDPAVHESLDLCLSCKACASDCPAGVDMARYKSEVLYRALAGRLRPRSHYTLGWLPRWLRPLDVLPGAAGVVNGLLRLPALRVAAGIDRRRPAPALAHRTFRRGWRAGPVHQILPGVAGRLRRSPASRPRRGAVELGDPVTDPAPTVLLWVDSFTNAMDPDAGDAAVAVLRAAGYRVITPDAAACCGLTWITTGQLPAARRRLTRLIALLEPHARRGDSIVGLEPSCTAVLRDDLLDLLPDDPRAAVVAGATRTVAEALTVAAERGWQPPDLSGVQVIAQPHCHQHAVMGFATDRALLEAAGATVTTLAGCCGLAGNFGMERGHYEMSVAVAETGLLPTLRDAPAGAVVLADGMSCRTQIHQLAGRPSLTLAQLLAARL
ncbi:FAD-binding and (Fe-S)-binding domain-containing protein [Nakamurella sp.]|uniref:FAD-binding and (Fe-S)-binding domain-containing protein n=1 Tax=Nakamurella sp. TaxID=1869182 RepID=UPI0037846085